MTEPKSTVLQNSDRNKLFFKTPASWHRDMWREALPMGNGIIGALAMGAIADETVIVNHCDLWHWGKRDELPDVSHTLAETRSLIDSGDFWSANWVSANALKEKGYATKLATPLPLCAIKLNGGERGVFSKYRRVLDMLTGEAAVSWNEDGAGFERRAFVSRADDTLVYRVTGETDCYIYLDMYETNEPDAERFKNEAGESLEVFCEGNYMYYAMRNEDGTDFGAVMRLEAETGTVTAVDDKRFHAENAPLLTAYVKFFVKSERKAGWARLKAELEGAALSYEERLAKHAELHGALYQTADLRLYETEGGAQAAKSNEELLLAAYEESASNTLIEKMWRFGRYLTVSGTREGGRPFPLYGLWHGRYSLPWPHNMANENLEMIYWHTETGGLIELLKPVIEYYTGLMDDFKTNARNLFGLDGIYVPAGTTPGTGLPNQIVPVIMNWIGAAGWLSRHFYRYYRLTGDRAYFRERIFPFMYEAAKFYAAYVVEDANGRYKIYPSVSPENTPKSLMPEEKWEHMAHPCPSAVNATMDIAIIKELLTNMAREGAEAGSGVAPEEVAKWRGIVEKLPEYGTTDEGDTREWNYPGLTERYTHRHLSHIYPVFPGDEYVKGRDDDVIKAFELAVDKRVLGSQSGWSLTHMACIYARFERAEKAARCLDIFSRSCLINSFFTLHNDWRGMGLTLGRGPFAPIQLDANMGFVNTVQEMLFFSSDALLKFLPACPERFERGEVSGFCFAGGRTDFKWDRAKKRFECTVKAASEVNIQLRLPEFAAKYTVRINAGGESREQTVSDRTIGLELPAGGTAIIETLE